MPEMITYHCKTCSFVGCKLTKEKGDYPANSCPLCDEKYLTDWKVIENQDINQELNTLKSYCQREILKETELWQAVKSIFAKTGKEW
jgi:hypothetical protein